jgi:hypothetical protein
VWGRSEAHRYDVPPGAPVGLANGQPSRAALVDRFVDALSVHDRAAIERLRVDENEYRRLIVPGSVKPGQPPQTIPDQKLDYFWKRNATLDLYTLDGLLASFPAEKYDVEGIEVHRVEQLAWYTVHRDPIIHLRSKAGVAVDLQLGSIAEHDGRFKFISYQSD